MAQQEVSEPHRELVEQAMAAVTRTVDDRHDARGAVGSDTNARELTILLTLMKQKHQAERAAIENNLKGLEPR